MRDLKPGLVECGQQEAGIRIAEIGLGTAPPAECREPPPRRCGWSHSRRARTRPRRRCRRPSPRAAPPAGPHRVRRNGRRTGSIAGGSASSASPRAAAMAVDRLGRLGLQGAAWRDDRDLHRRDDICTRPRARIGPPANDRSIFLLRNRRQRDAAAGRHPSRRRRPRGGLRPFARRRPAGRQVRLSEVARASRWRRRTDPALPRA